MICICSCIVDKRAPWEPESCYPAGWNFSPWSPQAHYHTELQLSLKTLSAFFPTPVPSGVQHSTGFTHVSGWELAQSRAPFNMCWHNLCYNSIMLSMMRGVSNLCDMVFHLQRSCLRTRQSCILACAHEQCFESVYSVLGYIQHYPWPRSKHCQNAHLPILTNQRDFCCLESNNPVVTATRVLVLLPSQQKIILERLHQLNLNSFLLYLLLVRFTDVNLSQIPGSYSKSHTNAHIIPTIHFLWMCGKEEEGER